MKSIADLREQFFLDEKPFWELYAGSRKASDRMIMKNLKESRMEQAFDMLEKSINLNRSNNDSFTVVFKEKPTNSAGNSHVNLDFEATKTADNSGSKAYDSKILGLQQSFTATIGELKQELQEQKHQREIDKIKLDYEKKIERLKEQVKASKADDSTKEIGKMIFSQLFAPAAAPVAVGHATVEQQKQEQHQDEEEVTDIDITGVDFNSVIASVAIIKNYMPNTETLLHNLSVTLEESEEMERNMMIQQLNKFFGA